MKGSLSDWRYGLVVAIGCAGIALAWYAKEANGLLVAVVAICIYGGLLPSLLSAVVFGLAFSVLPLLPGPDVPVEPATLLRVVSFLVAALMISLLVHHDAWVSASRRADREARLIVENMPGFGFSQDLNGHFRYIDRKALDYLGTTFQEMDHVDETGHFDWERHIHPDDIQGLLGSGPHSGEPRECEVRVRRYDGTWRWFRMVSRPGRDSSGRITGRYGTYIDIEDLKSTQAALRQSEQQLRQLIEAVPSLIWCTTPTGEPSYINKQLVDYTGLALEDLDTRGGTRLANAIQAVVHPDHRPAVAASLGHSFATGEPFCLKYRMRRADGAYRWIEGRAHPLRDDDGRIVHWYGVCLDIDDETRMQEALRAAHDKLARASQAASLAELSASIAHEVNQPLAAIVTNSAACQRWLAAAPPNIERARVTLERIIRNANSAAEVVSGIRALFKQTGQARAWASINEVIAEVCQLMAGETTRKNVRIETDLQSDLPQILVDRVQVQQVVVNLVRNGVDAMASVCGDPSSLQIRSRRCGANLLRVEVRDQGSGIEEPERVFEPFYTTKDHGMGMGLAICRSIIESHEGRIWAARNEPRGTTFAFTIPLQSGEPA